MHTSESAAVVVGEAEIIVAEDHSRAFGGVLGLGHAAADVVHQGGGAEEVSRSWVELVHGGGEVEEGGGDAGDTLFVLDVFEVACDPVCNRP